LRKERTNVTWAENIEVMIVAASCDSDDRRCGLAEFQSSPKVCPMKADDIRTTDHWTTEFARPRIDLSVFPWYLRWKLTWIISDIDEIERRLGDEFGLSETAPLNAEHIALIKERDALMDRLTNPVRETVLA
jgi:hypothetical protein